MEGRNGYYVIPKLHCEPDWYAELTLECSIEFEIALLDERGSITVFKRVVEERNEDDLEYMSVNRKERR